MALAVLLILSAGLLAWIAFLVALYLRATRMARTELAKQAARAELILGQAHDLLCDMVECSEREECLTVLDESQERWAVQILTNIQEHKNPDLCLKKPLSKHP